MSIKATIRQTNQLMGQPKQVNKITAQTITLNKGSFSLGDLNNVNDTGQADGAMMIYNGTTGNYDITQNIENKNLIIFGGTY